MGSGPPADLGGQLGGPLRAPARPRRPRPRPSRPGSGPCPPPSRRRRAPGPGVPPGCRAARRPGRRRPTRATPPPGRCRSRPGSASRPRWRDGRPGPGWRRRCPPASATLRASRTWPEDLALAQDHGVDTGGHAEEVGDGGLVVVAVDVVGQVAGRHARPARPGSRWRRPRRGGTWCRGVDLGAVAGGQEGHLGQVLPAGEVAQSLRDVAPAGRLARSSTGSGTVRWFSPTTTKDMIPQPLSGLVQTASADAIENAGIERRLPIGPAGPWRRPSAPDAARRPGRQSTPYSGPTRRSQLLTDPGGGRRGQPRRSHRHFEVAPAEDRHRPGTIDSRAVAGRAGKAAAPAPPPPTTDRFTAGSSVAAKAQPGAVHVAGLERPARDRHLPGSSPGLELRAQLRRDHRPRPARRARAGRRPGGWPPGRRRPPRPAVPSG